MDVNEKEILSQVSFWLVVTGGLLIGLEGLSTLADKELNPLQMFSGSLAENVKTVIYLVIGFSGLHQAYFGYTSFKKSLENADL